MKNKISVSSIKMLTFTIILLFTLTPLRAIAGPARHASVTTGVPGPLQQSELILEREHVIIKNREIHAQFWVANPSDKDVEVLMGFPIGYKDDKDNRYRFPGCESCEREPSSFSLESEAKHSEVTLVKDIKINYPIVYNWNMTFPAKRTTEFSVTYSNDTGESDDYNHWIEYFTYITHTGSYWASPISNAVIEYCSSDFINAIVHIPSGNEKFWIDNGDTELEIEWKITPKPYKTDKANKCIVWERKNWAPKVYDDEIKILFKWIKQYYIGADGFINKSREDFVINMCGKGYTPEEHLGNRVDIIGTKMTESLLLSILLQEINRQSFSWDGGVDSSIYPTHIKTDLQLLTLRYLRNYLYALHGHDFKDNKLTNCFNDVASNNKWSDNAKDNLDLILMMENKIKMQNESAWKLIRKSIKENSGRVVTNVRL